MLLVAALIVAVFWLDPPWSSLLVAGAFVVELGEAWLWWRWSRSRRPVTGPEAMVGSSATVVSATQVRIQGELWEARPLAAVCPGDQVEVVGVDGLTLEVRPA